MSLLVKGVQVVDGTGRPPYKADVLVQKNIISAIAPPAGGLKRRRAKREIDGLGHYLTPGFIDLHTDSDHNLTLFTDPAQSSFITQGVTTIIGGHCGASLAPLIYGSLESIRKWADPREINVNWHTLAELLKTLERLPLGVNFGTLTGHSTIRRALVGENHRRLTTKELAVFAKLLKQSLKDGAFGLSTGLSYIHGRMAGVKEIRTLVKIVADHGGVYATHLRNETDELLEAVKETIKIAKETGVKTVISHLRPIRGYENQFEEALKLLEKSSASASVYFDIHPSSTSTQAIYTLLPLWAQKGNLETMLEELKNKKTVIQIKKDWQKINNLEGLRIRSAPHHPYLINRSIEDADDLINLMITTRLRAQVSNANVNPDYVSRAISLSQSFIGSNSNSVSNTFPRYLEIAVKDNGMPIEQAIKKITGAPASYFSLKKRGMIKEGYIADLTIIGKSDYRVRQTILGGKIEEEVRGEILRYRQ